MRVLYFSNTSFINPESGGYNGGGWISSLINEVNKSKDVQVAVCFFGYEDLKEVSSDLLFYQIKSVGKTNLILKTLNNISLLFPNHRKREESNYDYYKQKLRQIINDYKPDIIHVFGSEKEFGLVSYCGTTIPIILHIQGLINPIQNAYLPPFFSWDSLCKWYRPIDYLRTIVIKRKFEINANRERIILSNIKYFLGRTDFDKRVTSCFSPKSCYFHGAEILRKEFYEDVTRKTPNKLVIISTISQPLYKGFDNILKTAFVLKTYFNIDFEWRVYGNIKASTIERIVHINHKDVNVVLNGIVSALTLRNELISSTCYFHPSHIDNSPNGLCEAQILGIPVIACNVGGVSSLIDDMCTGFLIPDNDPFQAAYILRKLYEDTDLNRDIGSHSRKMALNRHNKNLIVKDLLSTYSQIITIH